MPRRPPEFSAMRCRSRRSRLFGSLSLAVADAAQHTSRAAPVRRNAGRRAGRMGTHHTAVGRRYDSAAWKMLRTPSVHSDGMRVLAWAVVALWPHVAAATDWTLTDLGTLGGSISYGAAVSNGGYVAGCVELSTGVFHAFVYSNGTMPELDPGGAAGKRSGAGKDDRVSAGEM